MSIEMFGASAVFWLKFALVISVLNVACSSVRISCLEFTVYNVEYLGCIESRLLGFY